ncbi:hypothetical protein B0H10DRAFT_1945291 [Mycena sp. CBHHK59/15]|nr:hypothetical protein B0H10DRAFT_1945291 [Mycena sp. CBHHK59/15]
MPLLATVHLRMNLVEFDLGHALLTVVKAHRCLRAIGQPVSLLLEVHASAEADSWMCRNLDSALGIRTLVFTGKSITLVSLVLFIIEISKKCPNIVTVVQNEMMLEVAGVLRDVNMQNVDKKASFTDLPDDILLVIFCSLQEELCSLSRLSHRLNLLALLAFQTRVLSLSAGWQCMLLFRPHQALTHFIDNQSTVEEVSLHFIPTVMKPDRIINDHLQEQWQTLSGPLLDVIIGKSCTTLTIEGSPFLSLKGKLTYDWLEDNSAITLSPSTRNQSAVKAFTFLPGPLILPGVCWFFSVLDYSPVTSLKISVSPLCQSVLNVVTDMFPNLSELDINSCVLKGLTRLTLPVVPTLWGEARYRPYVVLAFLHLTHISASVPFILHFLTVQNPFPGLQSIEIITPNTYRFLPGLNYSDLAAIIKHLQKSITPPPTVSLAMQMHDLRSQFYYPEWWWSLQGLHMLGREEWLHDVLESLVDMIIRECPKIKRVELQMNKVMMVWGNNVGTGS